MNPYASYLGDRDPLAVIPESPRQLEALVRAIGPERMNDPYAPGKWSPGEILCHLADCELAFAFRLRQILAEPHNVAQPFDQDKWAKMYPAYSALQALDVFTAVRSWNFALIAAAGPAAYDKPFTHPERGTMTYRTVLETMAGHDLNHIRQLEAVAGRAAGIGA